MKQNEVLRKVAACNVTYHVLGETDRSAMPIGDGELAASVWVTRDGKLHCYLSRSDALTELDRTVKLGEIIIDFEPVQFTEQNYQQTLDLTAGCIDISGTSGQVSIWVERQTHSLCIAGSFRENVIVKPRYYSWRKESMIPFGEYQMEGKYKETADVIKTEEKTTIFYHKNGPNIIKQTAKLQNVVDRLDTIPDLLTNRIFGGLMLSLCEGKHSFLRVITHSCQDSEQNFERALWQKLADAPEMEKSRELTRKQWNTYWDQSYIFVENDPEVTAEYVDGVLDYAKEPIEYSCTCKSNVTKAYVYTKYMMACCNTGNMPVLYNGLLFNLSPGLDQHYSTKTFGKVCTAQPTAVMRNTNPDERSWCREQLWQNIRHPYFSVLARGEVEALRTLFKYYRRFWELNRIRAERYYGAQGQFNTEMTMSFGLQSAEIYGFDRTNKPDGRADNRWGGAVEISPGLELVGLMLDYYEYSSDKEFLLEQLIPYFNDLLQYIETRFPTIKAGVMQIGPLNAVETYRDTMNPTPVIAGLRSTLGRILEISHIPTQDRAYYDAFLRKVPEIAKSKETLLPAQIYQEQRFNVEVPELYAIYPFRNYTFYKDGIDLAKRTYEVRTNEYKIRSTFKIGQTPSAPSCSGWQFTGAVAAILGMREEAARILSQNSALQNPGTRFPGMWGPVYDAVPDTDHGANILSQLQLMVMQVEKKKIYLLPAFPLSWNVSFKLHADADTIVEGEWKDGKLMKILVCPEGRRKDIIIVE